MDAEPEDRAEIGRYGSVRQAHECGLVVLSAGESYWVERDGERVRLLVEPEEAEFLARQVRLYERESAYWPPPEPEVTERPTGLGVVFWWILFLVLGYGASFRWPELVEWGRVSGEAVQAGELYRVGTALFLHADIGHLVANSLIGGFFLFVAARQGGAVIALAATFAAGALGNWINVQLHWPDNHLSLGASTAVFGTVGWLVTCPLIRAARPGVSKPWLRALISLLAGLGLLAFLGTGDAFTDTSAHLTGFCSGLFFGALTGWWARGRDTRGRDR